MSTYKPNQLVSAAQHGAGWTSSSTGLSQWLSVVPTGRCQVPACLSGSAWRPLTTSSGRHAEPLRQAWRPLDVVKYRLVSVAQCGARWTLSGTSLSQRLSVVPTGCPQVPACLSVAPARCHQVPRGLSSTLRRAE